MGESKRENARILPTKTKEKIKADYLAGVKTENILKNKYANRKATQTYINRIKNRKGIKLTRKGSIVNSRGLHTTFWKEHQSLVYGTIVYDRELYETAYHGWTVLEERVLTYGIKDKDDLQRYISAFQTIRNDDSTVGIKQAGFLVFDNPMSRNYRRYPLDYPDIERFF